MDNFNIHGAGSTDNREGDLDAVRTYLRQAGVALLEAANSDNPLVTGLGQSIAERLGLSERSGLRMRRGREVYGLNCSGCQRAVEISTIPPHCCPACGRELQILWRAEP